MKKLFILSFFGIIPISILFIALYIFDPFQLYHKPIFRKTIFNSNMHYQAAGIINNYDFDSIILGSSILVNTSSNETSRKLGNQWINLSVSGGSFKERIDILEYAIYKKNIKTVIFSLEPWYLNDKNLNNRYAYLYDNNPFNDFQTYIDESFIACMFITKICLKGENNIDRPSQWITQPWVQQLLGGFPSWIKNSNRPDIHTILKQIQNFQQYPQKQEFKFPTSLIKVMQENPNIHFILIIPPFSTLYYKLNNFSLQKAIAQLLQHHLSNVKIYGFDNTEFPSNLVHYIDLVHYDEKVNSFMLDAIKNDTHRITLKNIDSYFEEMKKKVEAYDIEPLRKQIIESGVLEN